mmetsp:Transcript_75275/g.140363  ORF Transcript_75275/g.140363 Transcript_75275/m.140363 type:complete len:106 (+) Transcript_75275:85-402(+)
MARCFVCEVHKDNNEFSKSQLKKREPRCSQCLLAEVEENARRKHPERDAQLVELTNREGHKRSYLRSMHEIVGDLLGTPGCSFSHGMELARKYNDVEVEWRSVSS